MADQIIKTEREILNRSFDDLTQALKTEVVGTVDVVLDEPIDAVITNTVDVTTGSGSKVGVVDQNGDDIFIQNPFKTDGDSIYALDIDLTNSDFTNWIGDPLDLFKSPFSPSITNSTTDNPKQLIISFNRTIKALQIGLGENNGGDFSNIKISLLGSAGATRSIYDESLDNTKNASLNAQFDNQLFNSIMIEFFTSDPVSLSNITVQKARYNTTQIIGQNDRGDFVNFRASNKGNFKVALDEYQGDAFGRLRVSEPYTIFDSTLTYNTKDLFWSEYLNNGSVVHNRNKSESILSVPANTGDYAFEQTKMRFKYQPGKSHEILMTGLLTDELDVVKRIGLYDLDDGTTISETPKNGIYFENNSGIWSWNVANNGIVTESVTQSNWNIDKLDGNGDSGFNLDLSATQIWFADLEWLGVGTIRTGFVLDGQITLCHAFHHANNGFDSVYMNTANLPLNYGIISNGGTGSIKHICSTIISEGGFNPIGVSRALSNSTDIAIANNNTETTIGIRLKNDSWNATILPITLDILSTAKSDARVSLCINPVYNGTATWNTTNAVTVDYSETNLTVLDKGIVLYEGFLSGNSNNLTQDLESSLRIGKHTNGILDELWIVVESLTANDTYYTSLTVAELL